MTCGLMEGSTIKQQVLAPNRVFTAQWQQMGWDYNLSTDVISFQVKLYETTNVIEFIYNRGSNWC